MFFAVRNIPSFTHLVPVICDAALDEDARFRNNNDTQSPKANPRFLSIT